VSGSSNELDQSNLTLVVRELARGEHEGQGTLLEHLLRELKAIAQGHLRTQRANHSLQASALVNEAYLKLFDRGGLEIHDRVHFFALAAKAMRQVLVDHARRRRAAKRGGGQDALSIGLSTMGRSGLVDLDVFDLHLALEALVEADARQARVVELRYFGGLEVEEVARVLGVSKTTVERDWRMARAWLGNRLSKGGGR